MPSLRPVSMGPGVVFHPLESNRSEGAYDLTSPQSGHDSNISLKSELSDLESPDKQPKETSCTSDKEQLTDSIDVTEKSTGTSESGSFAWGFHSVKFEMDRVCGCKALALFDTLEFHCMMICQMSCLVSEEQSAASQFRHAMNG